MPGRTGKLDYRFPRPLTEGLIKARPNRFLMDVERDGTIFRCHCPATGRIGDLVFKDVPCLLSESSDKERKTRCTVEAISLDLAEEANKCWIGINQTMANRYLEHFIVAGQLEEMLGRPGEVLREVRLGRSRIDFKVGETFLEVKSPLTEMPYSTHVKHRPQPPMTSFDRLIKHFGDLAASIGKGKRAIVLLCYQYDAKPFLPPPLDRSNEKIEEAAAVAERSGVESWQVNLRIDKIGVGLIRYFRLHLFD